jgi:hypothetical protein
MVSALHEKRAMDHRAGQSLNMGEGAMKAAKLFILIGGLWAAFGFGCATQPAGTGGDAQESTSQADQDLVGGGDDCSAWAGCYQFCRRLHKCTSPAGCDALDTCLTNCDQSFPSAPGSCPYPE